MTIFQNNFKKIPFALSPYIAVVLGLYLWKNAFLAVFIYHIGLLAALLIFHKDIRWNELFLLKNKKLLFFSLIAGVLTGVGIFFLWHALKRPDIDLPRKMGELNLTGNGKWFFLLYFSTIHPFLEEIYWRFILEFKTGWISLGDIFFGAYHYLVLNQFVKFEYAVVGSVSLIIIAKIWRYFHQVLQENLIVFLSHAVADFGIFLFFTFLY